MWFLSSFHTKAHLLLPLSARPYFNILIPSYWRKKPWMYFSLVSWFSTFPVGAYSKDSWNQGRGWCHLQAPSRRVAYPHPTPPYPSPLLLHSQQRGKAGPTTTGTLQPAKVGMQLLLRSCLTQPGKWTTTSGSWFLQGASQLQYWKCFITTGKFCLCFWWQKCLGLPYMLVKTAPLLALTFPKLELFWCSPQCYQGSAGEHKGLIKASYE